MTKTRVTLTIDSDLWKECQFLKKKANVNWSSFAEASFYKAVSVLRGLAETAASSDSPSTVELRQKLFLHQVVTSAISDACNLTLPSEPKISETLTATDK